MIIILRLVLFRSELMLVIKKQSHATFSINFVITRSISDQIELNPDQLPILMNFVLTTVEPIIKHKKVTHEELQLDERKLTPFV